MDANNKCSSEQMHHLLQKTVDAKLKGIQISVEGNANTLLECVDKENGNFLDNINNPVSNRLLVFENSSVHVNSLNENNEMGITEISKCSKLNVLSNEKICLPQTYIEEMLKGNSSDNNEYQLINKPKHSKIEMSSNEPITTSTALGSSHDKEKKLDEKRNNDVIDIRPILLLPVTSQLIHNIDNPSNTSKSAGNVLDNCEMETSPKRSRGRKRKVIDYACFAEGETSIDESDALTVTKRKRGRAKVNKKASSPKDANSTNLISSVSADTSKNNDGVIVIEDLEEREPIKVKKKGRPRKKNASNFDVLNTVFQHISANTNAQTLTFEDDISFESPLDNTSLHSTLDIGDDKKKPIVKEKIVICAVCNLQFTKSSWPQHKYRSHNNLAWRVGDPPLDLNDQALVMSILSDLYKSKKPLHCEYCGLMKKSVLGYLSHKSVCQKTANEVHAVRIKCEHCDHTVLPVSMAAHLKTCKGLNTSFTPDVDYPEDAPSVSDYSSPNKRKAATKAENFLKEVQTTASTDKVKKPRCTWYVDFDFHPTSFGKKRIRNEIRANGIACCWFPKCKHQCSDLEEMVTHVWKCTNKITAGYTCKLCMFTFTTEEQIIEHTSLIHTKSVTDACMGDDNDMNLDIGDFDDTPKKNPNVNKKLLLNGISFLLKYRFYPTSTAVRYPPASDWTLQFCNKNYSIENLFENWRTASNENEKVDPIMFCKYLPPQKYSICTASIESKTYTDLLKLNYLWKRYKLFESDLLHNDTSTIFCGGSITGIAWAPTPFNVENCEQVLAICTNHKFDKGYPLNHLYKEPGIIQFWNCGTLNNNNLLIEKPKLEYCIVHDHGPIWCLEWCPSGCYDAGFEWNCMQRLGVLAVGSADSSVYIYSVSFPSLMSGKMYKVKPKLKLLLDTLSEIAVNGIEPHPTTLSWSKASGHQHLAVGYANGMIAVYDLYTTSSLLNFQSNDGEVKIMRPYHIFNAHYHAVTALHLYHLNNGRRWIMSGSLDRAIKYWDLDNPTVPISNFTKFIVTDGVWLNHWLSTVHTFDDCCGGGLTYSSIHQLRNFESESASIMHSNSHVSSISGSDWINAFVQGNVVGEVTGFFPHQLFYGLDSDKSFRKKKAILSYARVVDKNISIEERLYREQNTPKKGKPQPTVTNINFKVDIQSDESHSDSIEPSTYEEADDKYGLVFCDMALNSLNELPMNLSSYYKSNNSDKLFPSKPSVYPLQLVNKVVINPNHNSYLYYAVGYQSGFVRISPLKFINKRNS